MKSTSYVHYNTFFNFYSIVKYLRGPVFSLRDRLQILFLILSKYEPSSANPTKWSNTLKQFVDKSPTNGLSVVDHFGGWRLRGEAN